MLGYSRNVLNRGSLALNTFRGIPRCSGGRPRPRHFRGCSRYSGGRPRPQYFWGYPDTPGGVLALDTFWAPPILRGRAATLSIFFGRPSPPTMHGRSQPWLAMSPAVLVHCLRLSHGPSSVVDVPPSVRPRRRSSFSSVVPGKAHTSGALRCHSARRYCARWPSDGAILIDFSSKCRSSPCAFSYMAAGVNFPVPIGPGDFPS